MPDGLDFICDICGGVMATEKGLKIHTTRLHGKPAAVADFGPGDPDIMITEEQAPNFYDPEVEQPVPKPQTWREKLWGSERPAAPKAPTIRTPKKRRISTEGIWATVWTAGGVALCRTGADVPVGNCLQFQAPIVGDILDEAIAGTFIDTLLQPIAGSGKKFKKVSAILAMPILVGAMERSPGAAPMLEPILRQAIQEHLVAMAPVIKARQKQEAEYKKALDELGIEGGDDPIDAVIEAIFPQFGAPEHNGSGRISTDA